MRIHPLHDTKEKGGAIKFEKDGKEHIFSSYVNRLSGDRITSFGNSAYLGYTNSEVKKIFKKIKETEKVIEVIGNL